MDIKKVTFPNFKPHSSGNFSSASPFDVDSPKHFVLRLFLCSRILPEKSHPRQGFPSPSLCIFCSEFPPESKLPSNLPLDCSPRGNPRLLKLSISKATKNFPPQVTFPLNPPNYPLLTQSLKLETPELTSSGSCSPTAGAQFRPSSFLTWSITIITCLASSF